MNNYFTDYYYLNNAGGASTMTIPIPGFEANMRDCDPYMTFTTDDATVTVQGSKEEVDDGTITIPSVTETVFNFQMTVDIEGKAT
jgi:hypothetical protein